MRIGVDLGGTKIEVVALDDDGAERVRERVPTPREYGETVEAVALLVARAEAAIGGTATVGIGIPGAISPATGLVKNCNATWLIGRALDRDLQARLGRPVRVANDANCFTLSEATDGAARGAEVVFGVILGSGVGGGLAVRGREIRGVNAIAGEWGHNPLPWPRDDERPGPPCYCGKHGCIETFLSGRALARDHAEHGGAAVDARQVVALAEAGDPVAHATLERYEERLARALATVIDVVDPDVIVLGGGMSNVASLYEAVPRRWTAWCFSDQIATRLVPPVHQDSSGVRGAARLWPTT